MALTPEQIDALAAEFNPPTAPAQPQPGIADISQTPITPKDAPRGNLSFEQINQLADEISPRAVSVNMAPDPLAGLKATGRALDKTGRVLHGVAADVMNQATENYTDENERPMFAENTTAALKDEPLPVDETMAKMKGWRKYYAKATAGIVKSAPTLALTEALGPGAAGLSRPLAVGTAMGINPETGFDPVQAVIGAAIPAVARVGKNLTAEAITKALGPARGVLVESLENPGKYVDSYLEQDFRNVPGLSRVGVQKALETVGSAGLVNAYLTATWSLQNKDLPPDQYIAQLKEQMASNVGLSLLSIPEVFDKADPAALKKIRQNFTLRVEKASPIVDVDATVTPVNGKETPNATQARQQQGGVQSERSGTDEVGKTVPEASPGDSVPGATGQPGQGSEAGAVNPSGQVQTPRQVNPLLAGSEAPVKFTGVQAEMPKMGWFEVTAPFHAPDGHTYRPGSKVNTGQLEMWGYNPPAAELEEYKKASTAGMLKIREGSAPAQPTEVMTAPPVAITVDTAKGKRRVVVRSEKDEATGKYVVGKITIHNDATGSYDIFHPPASKPFQTPEEAVLAGQAMAKESLSKPAAPESKQLSPAVAALPWNMAHTLAEQHGRYPADMENAIGYLKGRDMVSLPNLDQYLKSVPHARRQEIKDLLRWSGFIGAPGTEPATVANRPVNEAAVDEYLATGKKPTPLPPPDTSAIPDFDKVETPAATAAGEKVRGEHLVSVRRKDGSVVLWPFKDEAGAVQFYQHMQGNADVRHVGKAKVNINQTAQEILERAKKQFPGAKVRWSYDGKNEEAPISNLPPGEVEPKPTEAQKEAGNYKKGHIQVHGLDITIENQAGSTRSGKDKDGKAWSVVMPADYGYIKRTEGKDGDAVDVYVGENPEKQLQVFCINQINPETGKFDEHKFFLGFSHESFVIETYDKAFSDGSGPARRANGVVVSGIEEFKDWLKHGDNKQPFETGLKPLRNFELGDTVKDGFRGGRYQVAALPGRKDVGQLLNLATNKLEDHNWNNNPHFVLEKKGEGKAPAVAEAVKPKSGRSLQSPKSKAKEVKTPSKFTAIGVNSEGHTIHEDERGVRSVVEKGIRISEPVSIIPTKTGVEISTGEREPRFTPVTQDQPKDKKLLAELKKYGQQIHTTLDAQRRYSDGERIYYFHDLDDPTSPELVTNLEVLNTYAPDQLLALPAKPNQYNETPTQTGATGTPAAQPADVQGSSGMDEGKPAEPGGVPVPQEPTPGPSQPSGDVSAGQPSENAGGGDASGGRIGDGLQPDSGAIGRPSDDTGSSTQAGQSGTESQAGQVATASLPPEQQNYRIGSEDKLGTGGDISKIRGNIAAIKLLQKLEKEGRLATPEEKKILAQYVGWGGLKQMFDRSRIENQKYPGYLHSDEAKKQANWEEKYGNLVEEVQKLLTEDEWEAAAASILNAHYTSKEVIEHGLWGLALRLGFRGGNTLENSAGIGSVVGLTPQSVLNRTRWALVEQDHITGRMLKQLYPQARVFIQGFQDAPISNNTVDLVIGNFPFDDRHIKDKRYPSLNVHNYFFARSLDTLKPGGILVAITSSGTMDNGGSIKARELMMSKADLVGAIRLPNTAFKKNAGTEVTTDILVLRKKEGMPFAAGQPFRDSLGTKTYDGKPIDINEYFIKHPEMMLGKMSLEGTMYGGNEAALLPNEGEDLAQALVKAVATFPENVFGRSKAISEVFGTGAAARKEDKENSFAVNPEDKQVYQVVGRTLVKPDWAEGARATKLVEQAKKFIELRDAAKGLIAAQFDPDGSDYEVEKLRHQLNQLYDKYVQKHGNLNGRSTDYLSDDPEFPLMLALENVIQTTTEQAITKGKDAGKTKVVTNTAYTKAEIFNKRTIYPRQAPTKADTLPDAVSISKAYQNQVNPEFIGQLLGKPPEEVSKMLLAASLAYENPENGLLESPEEYLSGFVKKKLRIARTAAESNPAYLTNVQALEKVQPKALEIGEIGLRLGSTWIPSEVIEGFMQDVLDVGARVSFSRVTGKWFMEAYRGYQAARNVNTYGGGGVDGHELVLDTLNLKATTVNDRVMDENGNEKSVKNPEKTMAARQKQDELKRAFVDWARAHGTFAPQLAQIYNEQFNGTVLRPFRGAEFASGVYPNANETVRLNQHQKDSVARGLSHSYGMFMGVGLGKTFTQATIAMEMRRLGMAKKPMIVVQNATLSQYAGQFRRLYPAANILVPTKKDREAANRKKLMSRIATGDYDAVIIPQSFLNQLPDDPARVAAYIKEEVDELKAALIGLGQKENRSPRARDIQKAIDRKQEKLKDLADRKVDNTITFEQLGVDALIVDEFHAYKRLEFASKMDNVKGLDRGFSQRGFGMLMKCRFIQERNNGKNVIGATGTPVSNTIAEAWNMMRYIRPDILEEYGMTRFDEFASTFGEVITQFELTATGTWKSVDRFAKFVNGPELLAAFHSVAEVKFNDDVQLSGIPKRVNGRPTLFTIKQTPQVKQFVLYLRKRLEIFDRMSGKEKKEHSAEPLVVFGLAKKATLDMRLIDPDAKDEPDSKLNTVVDSVYKKWKDSTDILGTQLIFADLYQSPKGEKFLDPDNTIPNPAYGKQVFNLYEEIKKKLVEKGIPAEQVVSILTADTDAKREALFNKVKQGIVRVMIGSTERMGVGVNVQNKVVAIHHMDAPPRPMDIEQRNGRAFRQGNENSFVDECVYGVENTLDAAMNQKLATKQKFINQILRGAIAGRSFEDAANEISLTFEEQMAAFSGDPLALEKVATESKVRQLESLQISHAKEVVDAASKVGYYGGLARDNQALIAIEEARAKRFADTFSGENMSLELNGTTWNDKKTVHDALESFILGGIEAAEAEAAKLLLTEFYFKKLPDFTINGVKFTSQAQVPIDFTTGKKRVNSESLMTWDALGADGKPDNVSGNNRSASGFFMSLRSQIKALQEDPERTRQRVKEYLKNVGELEGFSKQPFAQVQELATARARLTEIIKALEANAAAEKVRMDQELSGSKNENGGDESKEPAGSLVVAKAITTLGAHQMAMGKASIRAMLKGSHLPATTVNRALYLLDNIPSQYLGGLTLRLVNDPGTGQVIMEGSFLDLLNVAEVLHSHEVGPQAAAEEIVHSLAKFLPAHLRDANRQFWQLSLDHAMKTATGPARQYLQLVKLRGGLTTEESRDYWNAEPGAGNGQLELYYPLSNEDEFFADNFQKAAAEREAGNWITNFLKSLIGALKRLFGGVGNFYDQVFDLFRTGKIKVEPTGGMLFERNRSERAGTLVHTAEKADLALEVAATRGKSALKTEAMLISGQNEFLRVMLEKYAGEGMTEGALKQLGYGDLVGINQAIARVITPETYQKGIEKLRGMDLEKPYALQTGLRLAVFEKSMRRILTDYQNMVLKFESKSFQNKLDAISVAQVKAEALRDAGRAFEARIADQVGKITEQLKTSTEQESLLAQQKELQSQADYSEAVKSAMEDMVNLLAPDEIGAGLLYAGGENKAQAVVERYMSLKAEAVAAGGTAMQDKRTVEWAANLLVRLNDVAQTLVAAKLVSSDPKAMARVNSIQKELLEQFKADPAKTARGILREVRTMSTEAARAKAAFLFLKRDVKAFLRDIADTGAAAEVARLVVADPEFTSYQNQVYQDAGIEYRPEGLADLWYDAVSGAPTVPLPDGSTLKINLYGDEARFAEQMSNLDVAVGQWTAWKEEQDGLETSQRDPAYQFKVRWMETLIHVYRSSRAMSPSKLVTPFKAPPMGMLKYLIDDLGTRFSNVAKVASSNFERAQMLFRELLTQNIHKLVNARIRAAESHGFTVGRSNLEGSLHWYEQVGRELFDSWQNAEGGYEPGVRTTKGHVITQADMDEVRMAAKLSEGGFDILQRKIMAGKEGLAFPALIEHEVQGATVFRKSSKVSKYTMTRGFNSNAVSFVKQYMAATNEGRTRDAVKLIDTYFTDFVMSFLKDRSPILFNGHSDFERAYKVVLENMPAAGLPLADRNLNWLANEVANIEGMDFEDVKGAIHAEMDKLIRSVGKKMENQAGEISVQSIEASNSFTESRKDKIAPFWFYDTGFKTSASVVNFIHSGPSHYFANMIRALEATKADLERAQREMLTKAKVVADQQGISGDKARKVVVKQQSNALKAGQTFDDYVGLERKIFLVGKYVEDFKEVYGAGSRNVDQDLEHLARTVGATTGSVLFSELTGLRNILAGPLYLGMSLARINSSVLGSYAKAAWYIWGDASPRFLISSAVSAGKVAGYHLPVGVFKAGRTLLKTRNVRKAIVAGAEDSINELAQKLMDRVAMYKMLEQKGYYFSVDAKEEFEAKLALLSTGGSILDKHYEGLMGMLAKGTGSALTLYDAFLLTPIGKPLMPRMFDAILGHGSAKMSFNAIHNLQAQAEKVYQVWKDTQYREFNLDNPSDPVNELSPKEVFGYWMAFARTNTDLNFLKSWFEEGSVRPLQEAFIHYFRQRESGMSPNDAKLLNADEQLRMAAVIMQEVHVASALNRPIFFKKKGWLPQIIAPLIGWNINALRSFIRHSGRAAVDPHGRAFILMSVLLLSVLPMLLAAAFTDVFQEEVLRQSTRILRGEERATRQPWEREGTGNQAKGWIIAAATPIPFVAAVVNNALNDMPSRGSLDTTLFLQQRIKDVITYIGGAINTGDPTYGLDSFVRKTVPLSSILINKLPENEGSVEALNARRLMTRYGPMPMLNTKTGGPGESVIATPLSPFGERMLNAAMRGDDAGLTDIYQQAVSTATAIGVTDPERTVQQMYDSRNPYSRAFKGKLTEEQHQAFLGKLNPSELALVQDVENKMEHGATVIGASAAGAAPSKEEGDTKAYTGGGSASAGNTGSQATNFTQPPVGGPARSLARTGISTGRGGGGRIVGGLRRSFGGAKAARTLRKGSAVARRGRTGRSLRSGIARTKGTGAPRIGGGGIRNSHA